MTNTAAENSESFPLKDRRLADNIDKICLTHINIYVKILIELSGHSLKTDNNSVVTAVSANDFFMHAEVS